LEALLPPAGAPPLEVFPLPPAALPPVAVLPATPASAPEPPAPPVPLPLPEFESPPHAAAAMLAAMTQTAARETSPK
jgi:hypothetical protein